MEHEGDIGKMGLTASRFSAVVLLEEQAKVEPQKNAVVHLLVVRVPQNAVL